jgi:hypothetical protein
MGYQGQDDQIRIDEEIFWAVVPYTCKGHFAELVRCKVIFAGLHKHRGIVGY